MPTPVHEELHQIIERLRGDSTDDERQYLRERLKIICPSPHILHDVHWPLNPMTPEEVIAKHLPE